MAGTGTPPSVPLFDLKLAPADIAAVQGVMRVGRLGMGEQVEAFERAFADHLGCRHAVAVSSCTAALHLAYEAAGVAPGDEVIVPSITFAATAAAARYCGATPVFADIVGEHDLGLDPAAVAAKLTPRTKAVCVVHYGGYAGAVGELRALCDDHGVALLEDAAHAPSADVDGRMLGTFGLAGAFSFFSNKVLSVGEGGLLATDDDAVAELARRRRSPEGGLNYRMDDWRAALLRSRMSRLQDEIDRRRALTLRYRRALADEDRVVVPYRDVDVAHSSCYVMPILLRDPGRRPEIRRRLREEHGVQTSVLYPAVHEFTAYAGRPGTSALPRAEHAARAEVTLPLFTTLDEPTLDRVVAALKEVL